MEKEIKICPKCGSTNIGSEGFDSFVYDFCMDCGFQGRYSKINKKEAIIKTFPKVKSSELKKIQKEFCSKKSS